MILLYLVMMLPHADTEMSHEGEVYTRCGSRGLNPGVAVIRLAVGMFIPRGVMISLAVGIVHPACKMTDHVGRISSLADLNTRLGTERTPLDQGPSHHDTKMNATVMHAGF